MTRPELNPAALLAGLIAIGLGVLIGYAAWGSGGEKTVTVISTVATAPAPATTTATTTTTGGTTTTGAATTPANARPTTASCISLWNRSNNTAAQSFLRSQERQQAVRVHVGLTAETPPRCLVLVIGNDGTVFSFPEGGGTTFPYAPTPNRGRIEQLARPDRRVNAIPQPNGTLSAI